MAALSANDFLALNRLTFGPRVEERARFVDTQPRHARPYFLMPVGSFSSYSHVTFFGAAAEIRDLQLTLDVDL